MIDPAVTAHLEKYFKLSRTHFAQGDYALAAFFAITTIEETAKVLLLPTKPLEKRARKELSKEARNHRSKYLAALINLIDQSPRYESLLHEWKQEIESWWDTNKLMRIRNDCLYLRYGSNNHVTAPEKSIDIKLAALLVYIAGVAMAELDEYISGLPSDWKESILKANKEFRKRFMQS